MKIASTSITIIPDRQKCQYHIVTIPWWCWYCLLVLFGSGKYCLVLLGIVKYCLVLFGIDIDTCLQFQGFQFCAIFWLILDPMLPLCDGAWPRDTRLRAFLLHAYLTALYEIMTVYRRATSPRSHFSNVSDNWPTSHYITLVSYSRIAND